MPHFELSETKGVSRSTNIGEVGFMAYCNYWDRFGGLLVSIPLVFVTLSAYA